MRYLLLVTALVLLASVAGAMAYTKGATIRLVEYVGRTWSNELIHYDLEFTRGEFPGGTARLVDDTGMELPVQFTNVASYDDGSLKSATAWLVVTLEPKVTREFRLLPGACGVGSDLRAVTKGDTLQVTTAATGALFHLGAAEFAEPISAARAPAYLQAIRHRSGAWGGRGWFETPHACRAYEVKVLDNGPVFVRIGFRYAFDGYRGAGKDLYAGTVRIAAGQEFIEIDETFSLGDPKTYRFPSFADRAEEILWDWWSWNPHDAESNFCFSLYDGLQPTRARWYGHNATMPEKRTGRNPTMDFETDYALDYRKDRFDISVNAYLRGCPDQGKSYLAWRADDPASDAVGVIGVRGVDWINPDMLPRPSASIKQVTDTSDLRIHALNTPDLVVKAPLHLGKRAWGLLTLKMPEAAPTKDSVDKNGKPVYSFQTAPSQALMLQAKYGNRQLDKIKDWTLAWQTGKQYPALFTNDHRIEAVRARILASEALKKELKNHIPVQRYLREPNDKNAQAAYQDLINWCEQHIGIFFDHGYCSHRGTNNNQYPWWMQEMSARYDLVMGMPEVAPEQKETLKAYFSFCAHMLQDDEFMPPRKHGYGWGSANMPVNTRGGRAVSAAALSDNPDAGAWLERALEYIDVMVVKNFGEDGSPLSGPHYTSTTADPLMNMALPLYYAGCIKPIQQRHPRLKRFVEHLIDRQTPPDIRVRGERVLPTIGHTRMEFDDNIGKYATLMALTDKKLAGEALWMWKRAGTGASGFMDGVYYLREDFPEIQPKLESRVYPGFGAFLRNGFPHPNETYLAIHRGDHSIDHYDIDVGSFHLYAKGVPLCLDFSSMYNPNCWQSLWHNTISWNVKEHAPKTPAYPRDDPRNFYAGTSWFDHDYQPHTLLDIAPDSESENAWPEYHGAAIAQSLTPEADFLRTSSILREFQVYPFFNKEEGIPSPWAPHSQFDRVRMRKSYEWQRLFFFVKDEDLNGPNYLVVHDDFDGQDEMTPQFNLWCLADEQRIGDNYVFWKGQYHVDLDMYVAWPKQAEIGTRAWWHTERGPAQPAFKDGRERQIAAHVKNRPGNGGFTVLLYPRGRYEVAPTYSSTKDGSALAVEIGARADVLFISKTARHWRNRGVDCRGTVAMAKLHPDYTALILAEAGQISYKDLAVKADIPVSARITEQAVTAVATAAGTVTLTLPDRFNGKPITLNGTPAGQVVDGAATVTIPAGTVTLEIK